MASVFLSYDREDADRARHFARALERAGHEVWWDLHVRGGAQFSKVIEQALKAADVVVVLWSVHSVESAWVRDEAGAGRDSGRLVPVTIDGTPAPIGFRQFQTIDLSRWKGRGNPAALQTLLADVEAMAPARTANAQSATPPVAPMAEQSRARRPWLIAAGAIALLLALGAGAWAWFGRGGLPVVEVAAANASPRSQAAASDLYVKLGSLARVGEGKWQLVDSPSAPSKPDLIFRTADLGSPQKPQANLVLLDGKNGSLLWSREFSFPPGGEADLRQHMSFTAGRVLGCALESRDAGGLRPDLLKLFLDICATLAEVSIEDPMTITRPLRSIVAAQPSFVPAWGRLLYADMFAIDYAGFGVGEESKAISDLRQDMEKVRNVAPELPELILAEAKLLPPTAYSKRLELLAKAAERAPDKAEIFADQNSAFQQVGRMSDAVEAARRAAELDPLSPTMTTQLIMTRAYAGQLEEARKELARAERLWAGTGALRDALWGFHLRYGDPTIAREKAPGQQSGEGLNLYLNTRADPSPANVEKFASYLRQFESNTNIGMTGWAIQALGEFDRVDEAFSWITRTPTDTVAVHAYLLFRPALAGLRRDPRFMQVAERIGLIDYWRSSGKWPDFCNDPQLLYDCKAEAAKYG